MSVVFKLFFKQQNPFLKIPSANKKVEWTPQSKSGKEEAFFVKWSWFGSAAVSSGGNPGALCEN